MREYNATFDNLNNMCLQLNSELKFIHYIRVDDMETINNRIADCNGFSSDELPDSFSSEFIFSSISRSFINYYCLRLTSIIEFYLKDTIKEMLKSNARLLARGFDTIHHSDKTSKIKKKCIAEEYSEENYIKYLNYISSYFTKGKLFSKKYKNFIKLFDFDDKEDKEIIDRIDNLFKYRNDIVHSNRHTSPEKIPVLEVSEEFSINRETILTKQCTDLVIEYLIDITTDVLGFLREEYFKISDKWNIEWFEPTEHYNKAFKLYNEKYN